MEPGRGRGKGRRHFDAFRVLKKKKFLDISLWRDHVKRISRAKMLNLQINVHQRGLEELFFLSYPPFWVFPRRLAANRTKGESPHFQSELSFGSSLLPFTFFSSSSFRES